jgi:uncharacterized protein (DUF433 family)
MAVERSPAFPHIVRQPGVQGGEPIVDGTRVPVRALVVAHRLTPDVAYLATAYPSLTPALIQEALDFYRDNQAEVDRLIRENEADLR